MLPLLPIESQYAFRKTSRVRHGFATTGVELAVEHEGVHHMNTPRSLGSHYLGTLTGWQWCEAVLGPANRRPHHARCGQLIHQCMFFGGTCMHARANDTHHRSLARTCASSIAIYMCAGDDDEPASPAAVQLIQLMAPAHACGMAFGILLHS